jgi:DNA-binding NarL/FixJ family response regulator
MSTTTMTAAVATGRKAAGTRLSSALGDVPGTTCVLAGEAAEVVRLIRAQRVDVLLVDLDIGPTGALGLLDAVQRESPETRSVILAPSGGEFDAGMLVAHGARGFLAIDADPALVRKCVRAVNDGEYWLSRDQVGPLLEQFQPGGARRQGRTLDVLTPREHDIVRAVLRGASNGAIASDFALSPQTVRNHLSSIYFKLGVATRLELALLVMHTQGTSRS